jgi:hypothetical protein
MLRRRPLIFHLVSVWPAENDPWTTCSPQLPISSNSKDAQDSLSNFCCRRRCSFQFTFGTSIENCTIFLKSNCPMHLSNSSSRSSARVHSINDDREIVSTPAETMYPRSEERNPPALFESPDSNFRRSK